MNMKEKVNLVLVWSGIWFIVNMIAAAKEGPGPAVGFVYLSGIPLVLAVAWLLFIVPTKED